MCMAYYLRDQLIENISVDAETICQISSVFEDRLNTLTPQEGEAIHAQAFFTYIIRFDSKGYRVFSLDELLRYFNQAKEVERVIFTLETTESTQSMRQSGTFMELQLDEQEPSRCIFQISSDQKDWVDASFSVVNEVLSKSKNRNGWVRTAWTPLFVQILGIALGFILSLWAAFKISPFLKIENPFLISFLFLLLIFSNAWTYVNQTLLRLISRSFPHLKFVRPEKQRIQWLLQSIVGSAVFAAVGWLLALTSYFLLDVLKSFIRVGT